MHTRRPYNSVAEVLTRHLLHPSHVATTLVARDGQPRCHAVIHFGTGSEQLTDEGEEHDSDGSVWDVRDKKCRYAKMFRDRKAAIQEAVPSPVSSRSPHKAYQVSRMRHVVLWIVIYHNHP